MLQKHLRAWFVRWHGEGSANQYDFYRCQTCRRLVTWKHIKAGPLTCCPGSHIVPTNPTIWETFKVMVLPWTI